MNVQPPVETFQPMPVPSGEVAPARSWLGRVVDIFLGKVVTLILAVLALGPRSAADPTDVTWDDAENWTRFMFRGGFVARAGPVAIRVRPGRGRAVAGHPAAAGL